MAEVRSILGDAAHTKSLLLNLMNCQILNTQKNACSTQLYPFDVMVKGTASHVKPGASWFKVFPSMSRKTPSSVPFNSFPFFPFSTWNRNVRFSVPIRVPLLTG